MNKHLIIITSSDLIRIPPDKIIYISSDGNYSNLFLCGGEQRLLTFQLGQIEKMIAEQLSIESRSFIRIGKSLIINRNYIYYINIGKQQLVMMDNNMEKHSVCASKEALKQLKELVEKELKVL